MVARKLTHICQGFLCTRHHTRHETHVNWMNYIISEVSLKISSIAEMKKFRLREAQQSEQGHTAGWWQSWKLDPSPVIKEWRLLSRRATRIWIFYQLICHHVIPSRSLDLFESQFLHLKSVDSTTNGIRGCITVNTVLGMWKVLCVTVMLCCLLELPSHQGLSTLNLPFHPPDPQ